MKTRYQTMKKAYTLKCKYIAPSKPTMTLDSKMDKEKYPTIFAECQKQTAGKKAYIRW